MSLRTRLMLIFSFLMGGMLLVAGILGFLIASNYMIKKSDLNLQNTAQLMVTKIQSTGNGIAAEEELTDISMTNQYLFQLWDQTGNLILSDPPQMVAALDGNGLGIGGIRFETVDYHLARLRVLSLPVTLSGKTSGTLQIATNIVQITDMQNTMGWTMVIISTLMIGLTAFVSWRVTTRVLYPLEDVVATASQISQVGDLSRRIPVKSQRKDEVGVLIQVMNKTFERLERLFMSQQRFLADVSHDLRTPLTVIKGNAEIMRKTGWADTESLDSIDEEVNHLTHMVLDLMLLVQAESGKLSLELKPVRLDQVIEEIVKRMQPLTEGKLNLAWHNGGETWVKGDAYRLKQVFENLVSNAVQYTPRGGSVTIDLSRTTKSVLIHVADTGRGIPPEDLPHVFERFFRAEPSRPRSKDTGFGLGLAISNWIIKKHHGEIRVKSRVGQGTIFTVRLNLFNKVK